MTYVNGQWELGTPFNQIDNAILECLKHGFAPGFVEYTREQQTNSYVIYHLKQEQLGDLGTIEITERNPTRVLLTVYQPSLLSTRDVTPQETAAINALAKEEQLAAQLDLRAKLRVERDLLEKTRTEHQIKVIDGLFARLISERLLIDASGTHYRTKNVKVGPITFKTPTGFDDFFSWLGRQKPNNEFRTEKGTWVVQPMGKPIRATDGRIFISMRGRWIANNEPRPNIEMDVIEVWFERLDDKLVGEASCVESPQSLVVYFDNLLANINTRWSETLGREESTPSTEERPTQTQWYLGKTLSDTPTSGSLIQLPDGELVQAKKVTLPLEEQNANAENKVTRTSRLRKATPEEARKVDIYKDIIERVEKVSKRLGFSCQELDGSNIDAMLLRFFRVYDRAAIDNLDHFAGEPSLMLQWADENGLKVVNNATDKGAPVVRVEFVVKDPALDIDLARELWKAIYGSGLRPFWREEDAKEIISLYRDAIRRAAHPLGWEIPDGSWIDPRYIPRGEQWEIWARAPRNSGLSSGEIFISIYFPDTPVHFGDFKMRTDDSPEKRERFNEFLNAVQKEVEETRRGLAQKPFWARKTSLDYAQSPNTTQSARENHAAGLPKRKSQLNKWKKAWSIIRKTQGKFKKEYENTRTDNPEPKVDDLRDALGGGMNWKPSEKTVRRIIKAGDEGLLK